MGYQRLYLCVEHLCAVLDVSARKQDKELPEKLLTVHFLLLGMRNSRQDFSLRP